METPSTATSENHTLRMFLMIAACFAIGSIGFFLAVLMERGAQTHLTEAQGSAIATHELVLTQQQKEAVMQSLSLSKQPVTATTSRTVVHAAGVSPTQADTHDANAAAKLHVLESLNSH